MKILIPWLKSFNQLWTNKFALPLLIALTLTILLAYPLFRQKAIPGPDSPFYVAESQKLLSITHHYTDYNLDRKIVLMFPVVLSSVTGVSVMTSVKMMILLTVFSLTCFIYLVTRQVSNNTTATLTILLTIFSPALYRLTWDLYANLFGLLMVFALIWTSMQVLNEINKKRYTLLITIALLLGLTFQVYGVLAMANFIILFPFAFMVGKKLFKIDSKLLILWSILGFTLLILAGLPLSLKSFSLLLNGIFKPIINQALGIQLSIANETQVTPWLDSKSYSLFDFPLNKELFILFYETNILFLAVVGILLGFWRHWRKPEHIAFSVSLCILFLFTQQNYLGLSWLIDRFVLILFPVINYAAATSLEYLINLVKHSPLMFWQKVSVTGVVLLIVVTPLIQRSVNDVVVGFSPTISEQEFAFLERIAQLTLTDKVYSLNTRHYWLISLAPLLKYQPVEYYAACGNQEVKARITPADWLKGYAFSQHVSLNDSLETLAQLSDNQEYYVIVSENDDCVNPALFFNSSYQVIAEDSPFYLVQRKYYREEIN